MVGIRLSNWILPDVANARTPASAISAEDPKVGHDVRPESLSFTPWAGLVELEPPAKRTTRRDCLSTTASVDALCYQIALPKDIRESDSPEQRGPISTAVPEHGRAIVWYRAVEHDQCLSLPVSERIRRYQLDPVLVGDTPG